MASGERRVRTLEIHTYYLKRHLLPLLGSRVLREITVDRIDILRRPRAGPTTGVYREQPRVTMSKGRGATLDALFVRTTSHLWPR
jgi:hypothetical protein